MKLKSLLKVLDRYSYIEIDNELGETIIDANTVGYEDEPIKVYEMNELLENYENSILDKKVIRLYYDFGTFFVEVK